MFSPSWNRRWSALLVVLATIVPLNELRAGEPLFYGPLPLENPSVTQARNQPLADLLSELLGREVRLRLFANHGELIDALAAGQVDIAELGPLPFLLARDRVPDLAPVVTFRESDGSADYRCVIAAPMDGLSSLEAAPESGSALSLALTRPESTCGPVAMFAVLTDNGLSPARASAGYLGGHDEVAIAVLRQQFALGGMKQSVARRFFGLGLRELAASEPVPGFVLVVRPNTLEQRSVDELARALIELEEAGRQRLQNGNHGFTAVDESLLASVAAMRSRALPWLERLEK